MKAIWKREMQGYFCTVVGYVYLCVFLTVSSVLFYLAILSQRSGDLPTFIGEMSYLWMLLSPVLTMRLLAEEKQKKTDQRKSCFGNRAVKECQSDTEYRRNG